MRIKPALHDTLSKTHSVTSLLGTNETLGGKDLYQEALAPESATYPRITMEATQRDRVRHMQGPNGLVDGRVGLVISDKPLDGAYAVTDAVADAIRLAIKGYKAVGTIGSGDNTVTVSDIYIDTDFDNTLFPIDKSGSPIFQRIMELVIWYREPLT